MQVMNTYVVSTHFHFDLVNRSYYMATWGYEFYLRVLKVSFTRERSERLRDTFSTREDKIRIPKRPCYVLFITQNRNSLNPGVIS